jgi:hypothetical protein
MRQRGFAVLTLNEHLGTLLFEERPQLWVLICTAERKPLWQFPCSYDQDPDLRGQPYLPLTGAAVWTGTRFELPAGDPDAECCRGVPAMPTKAQALPPVSGLVQLAEDLAPQYLNEAQGEW